MSRDRKPLSPALTCAAWKVGAVYMPLDPTHPAALVGMIVEEAQPAQVLTLTYLYHQKSDRKRFCWRARTKPGN